MTNYVKVEHGAITWGPSALPKSYKFADGRTTGNFDSFNSATLHAEGFIPVEYNEVAFNPEYQILAGSAPTITESLVTYNYTVAYKDVNAIKQSKYAQVEKLRWQLMYDSNVVYNGHTYATDQFSINQIAVMAAAAMQAGTGWTIPYKDINGAWIVLTEADILAINTLINARFSLLNNQAMHVDAAIAALTDAESVANYAIVMN